VPTKEVVLLVYLQEEPPPARRRLSQTATIRAQPAGLAAGLTATQANSRPEIAQPAAAKASSRSPREQSGRKGSPKRILNLSHRQPDSRFSASPPVSVESGEGPRSPNRDSSESTIRSRSRNSGTVESVEDPRSPNRDSSEPTIRSRSRNSGIPQKQRLNRRSFSTSTFSSSARESTSTGTSTGTGPENTQDPGTTENNRNPGDIPNPEVRERMRNSGTGTHRSRGTANGAVPMPNSAEPSHTGNDMLPPRTNSRTNEDVTALQVVTHAAHIESLPNPWYCSFDY
jgi:hypothetical protein